MDSRPWQFKIGDDEFKNDDQMFEDSEGDLQNTKPVPQVKPTPTAPLKPNPASSTVKPSQAT